MTTTLITGANTGIGEVTARELMMDGHTVIIACRNRTRAEAAAQRMAEATGKEAPEILQLDLSSLASVRDAAHRFLDSGRPLHRLVNNAGVAGFRGITEDGFELAFGVNHMGHFLLTKLLEDRLAESASADEPARVVNVASRAHQRTPVFDLNKVRRPTKTITGYSEYAVSKLANVLFSSRFASEAKGRQIHSYALHPGVVASDVWRRVPQPFRWMIKRRMLTSEEGALTTLHCVRDRNAGRTTGMYYADSALKESGRLAKRQDFADDLWNRSHEWAASFLP